MSGDHSDLKLSVDTINDTLARETEPDEQLLPFSTFSVEQSQPQLNHRHFYGVAESIQILLASILSVTPVPAMYYLFEATNSPRTCGDDQYCDLKCTYWFNNLCTMIHLYVYLLLPFQLILSILKYKKIQIDPVMKRKPFCSKYIDIIAIIPIFNAIFLFIIFVIPLYQASYQNFLLLGLNILMVVIYKCVLAYRRHERMTLEKWRKELWDDFFIMKPLLVMLSVFFFLAVVYRYMQRFIIQRIHIDSLAVVLNQVFLMMFEYVGIIILNEMIVGVLRNGYTKGRVLGKSIRRSLTNLCCFKIPTCCQMSASLCKYVCCCHSKKIRGNQRASSRGVVEPRTKARKRPGTCCLSLKNCFCMPMLLIYSPWQKAFNIRKDNTPVERRRFERKELKQFHDEELYFFACFMSAYFDGFKTVFLLGSFYTNKKSYYSLFYTGAIEAMNRAGMLPQIALNMGLGSERDTCKRIYFASKYHTTLFPIIVLVVMRLFEIQLIPAKYLFLDCSSKPIALLLVQWNLITTLAIYTVLVSLASVILHWALTRRPIMMVPAMEIVSIGPEGANRLFIFFQYIVLSSLNLAGAVSGINMFGFYMGQLPVDEQNQFRFES